LIASNRTSRTAIAAAADNLASKAEDIGTGTGAFVSRTTEWGQQTAARMADRTTDVVGPVGDKTAHLAGAPETRRTVWRVVAGSVCHLYRELATRGR
jgi:hypothetical protein